MMKNMIELTETIHFLKNICICFICSARLLSQRCMPPTIHNYTNLCIFINKLSFENHKPILCITLAILLVAKHDSCIIVASCNNLEKTSQNRTLLWHISASKIFWCRSIYNTVFYTSIYQINWQCQIDISVWKWKPKTTFQKLTCLLNIFYLELSLRISPYHYWIILHFDTGIKIYPHRAFPVTN